MFTISKLSKKMIRSYNNNNKATTNLYVYIVFNLLDLRLDFFLYLDLLQKKITEVFTQSTFYIGY